MDVVLNICYAILIIAFTIATVCSLIYFGWIMYNKAFHDEWGYWHDYFQKIYNIELENAKIKMECEYEEQLKNETTKILSEFYENDKRKDDKNDI